MEVLLSVTNLVKRYGGITALDGISFEVKAGEIVSLLGPNGSGKTSTLECIEGLRSADGGSLRVLGIEQTPASSGKITSLGIQLQNSSLPPLLRVEELFRLFCAYHRLPFREEMITRLNLQNHRAKLFGRLSTGLQRRVALALAILHRPRLVLLDEPSAGLDVESRRSLHDCLRELRSQGTGILMSSHDMAEVDGLSDRVLVLIKGNIVASGSPAALRAVGQGFTRIMVHSEQSSAHPRATEIASAGNSRIDGDYLVFYSAHPAESLSSLINLLKQNQDEIIDIRVERPSLEERYLEIISEGLS